MTRPTEILFHELPQKTRQTLLRRAGDALLDHAEIRFAYAHGSFVGPGPFRDLDIAVHLGSSLPPSRFVYEDGLGTELSIALATNFPVDVRIANGTPFAFQHHAYQGRLLLDRDPEQRAGVLAYVAARHLDIKPILEHHAREAFSHGS